MPRDFRDRVRSPTVLECVGVVSCIAYQGVVVSAAIDRVVASAAIDRVGFGFATDLVVTAEAGHRVGAGGAVLRPIVIVGSVEGGQQMRVLPRD